MIDALEEKARIFVVDDESVAVKRLTEALGRDGYEVEGFVRADEAMARIVQSPPDVILLDVRLKDADGVELLPRIRAHAPQAAVILVTGYASIDHAVKATKKGAYHYMAKPVRLGELRRVVAGALAQGGGGERLARQAGRDGRFGEIIGVSSGMREVFNGIARIAPVDCSVLIQGESGTGKELVARSLHRHSARAGAPFVPFNCGAFSEDLVANELFGHEKGAFTGAVGTKLGLLETAGGGTIFLDEIGDMPLSMQVKLLRVIQERMFLRVGGVEPVGIDVRFIAASNREVSRLVEEGSFRLDLYYRLKTVTIDLPPLRARQEDIPPLVAHFVAQSAARFGKTPPEVSAGFLERLAAYSFPGNVRELQHIVERAVALSRRATLGAVDLPGDLREPEVVRVPPEEAVGPLKQLERDHIVEVYRRTGYNQSETARRLGVSRTTLWRRLKEFGMTGRKGAPSE